MDQSLLIRGVFVDKIQVRAEKYIRYVKDYDELGLIQEYTNSRYRRLAIHNIQAFQEGIEMAYSLDGESPQHTLVRTLTHDLGDVPPRHQGYDRWLKTLSIKTPSEASTPLDHTLSDSDLHVARSKYESTQTRSKAEIDLSEYLEIINRHQNDQLVEKIHRLMIDACTRTRLFITSRGLLGKGLKDIQEGDLVALIAGVGMPIIIRKGGSSYRSKGPAYIHGMMYGEMWPKDEIDLIDIVLR
jgi:hypothetical protein